MCYFAFIYIKLAGQERFHALGPIYYRDAQGALLVYDITDRDSFTKVRNWVKELRKIVGNDIVLVIAGNKSDLEKKRQVDESEAVEYAKTVNAIHINCSAKTGNNVEQAFLELTKGMLKLNSNTNSSITSNNNLNPSNNPNIRPTVSITHEEEKKPSGCC
jgi:Ras-related protein Rab-21